MSKLSKQITGFYDSYKFKLKRLIGDVWGFPDYLNNLFTQSYAHRLDVDICHDNILNTYYDDGGY